MVRTTNYPAEAARVRSPRSGARTGARRGLLLAAAALCAASSSCSLFMSIFYGELRTIGVSASALGSVTVEADAPNESRVDGRYAFRDGTRVTLRAEPSEGGVFDSWSGGYTSYDAEFSFTVAKNAELTANFVSLHDPWLVMIYMAAANTLEADGYYDLNRMELGLAEAAPALRGNLKVVALFDRISTADYLAANPGVNTSYNSSDDGDWSGARLFEVRPDRDPASLASHVIPSASSSLGVWRTGSDDEMDMGDRGNLTAFAAWATEAYPEYRRNALILWNHGSGLAASRSIGFDDEVYVDDGRYGSAGQLYIGELDEALEPVYGPGGLAGHRLEAFGADACHLGLYEAAYELRELAGYFAASPATEYGGWNYARLFSTEAAFDSGRAFVREVVQGYEAKSTFYPNTMTALDLAGMESLKTAVDGFGAALLDYRDGGADEAERSVRQAAIEALRNASVAYYSGSQYDLPLYAPYHDLGDFSERVNKAALPADATAAAEAVLEALSSAVVYTWTASEYGGFKGACGRGLGIFFSHGDETHTLNGQARSHYAYQGYYTDGYSGIQDIPYGYLEAADQGAGSTT